MHSWQYYSEEVILSYSEFVIQSLWFLAFFKGDMITKNSAFSYFVILKSSHPFSFNLHNSLVKKLLVKVIPC